MIALCVRCFFAQVDAHWQTHFTQFSQHPQTRHTEHRAPLPIHSPTTTTTTTKRTPGTQLRRPPPSHRRTSLPTAEDTLSVKCTHSCTARSPKYSQLHMHTQSHAASPRARTSTHTRILTFFSSITFFHPVKRQLQARRPRQRQEGSSREGVATASCWEHIWLLEEMRAGEAACSPASHGNSTPHGSQKVIGTPPFLSLLLH